MNELSPPRLPVETARFLAWLMKVGGMPSLERCKRKWEREGIDVEECIRNLDISVIRIQISRSGEKVVKLVDWAWAAQWVSFHNLSIPHHGQMRRII
ncbi:MAG: hypothetical protein IBX41_01250 [Methanophagales archaeon]|nr:hypothetical protein [Methanophagales archaeon]